MGRLVSDTDKSKEKPPRKKENNYFPTKIVIRRLPPSLTKDDLKNELGALPEHDYFNFFAADYHFGHEGFARAYINFKEYKDVYEFRNKFDGYIFYDNKGKEYNSVVELAACQQVPKERKKRDHKSDTIDKDADYLQFLEQIGKEEERLPSAEIYIEELEAAKAIDKNKVKVVTPLIEFLKEKRESRIAARQAAILQREKEKIERIEKEKEKRREREKEKEKEKERRNKMDDKKERRDRKSPEKSYRETKKFSENRGEKKASEDLHTEISGYKGDSKGKFKRGNDKEEKIYSETKVKEIDRGKAKETEKRTGRRDREKERENFRRYTREKDYFSDREKERYEKDRHGDKELHVDKERRNDNDRKERYRGRYIDRDKNRYFDDKERYDKDKGRQSERDKDRGKDRKMDSRDSEKDFEKVRDKRDKEVFKEKSSDTSATLDELKPGNGKHMKTDEILNTGQFTTRRPSVEHEDPSIVSVTATSANKDKSDHGYISSNKNVRKARPEIKIYRPPSERSSLNDKQTSEKKSDDKDAEKNPDKEKRKESLRGKPPYRDRYRDDRSSYPSRDRYNRYDRFERYDNNRYEKDRYVDRYHVDNRRKNERRSNRYDREKDVDKSRENKQGNKEREESEKNGDKSSSKETSLQKLLSKSMDNIKKDPEKERAREMEQERYRRNWLGNE